MQSGHEELVPRHEMHMVAATFSCSVLHLHSPDIRKCQRIEHRNVEPPRFRRDQVWRARDERVGGGELEWGQKRIGFDLGEQRQVPKTAEAWILRKWPVVCRGYARALMVEGGRREGLRELNERREGEVFHLTL